MTLEATTLQEFGSVGISQAVGVDVCTISNPGVGRWKIWGHGRHSEADGLRLLIGSTEIVQIPLVSWLAQDFGPIVIDITNPTDDIILELAVATAADGSSSAILYAQRLSP